MTHPSTKLARSVFKQAFAECGIAVDSVVTYGGASYPGDTVRLIKGRARNNTYPSAALARAKELFKEHGFDVHMMIGTSYIECLAEVSK